MVGRNIEFLYQYLDLQQNKNFRLKTEIIIFTKSMTSTLDTLLTHLRKDKTQIRILDQLVQQLLNSKHGEECKMRVSKQMVELVTKIGVKINTNIQSSTYKYIINFQANFMEVIMHCAVSGDTEGWLQVAAQLLKQSKDNNLLNAVLLKCVSQSQIDFKLLKDGYMIFNVLSSINKQFITQNLSSVLKFVLHLDHINQIQFQQPEKQIMLIRMKKCFQEVLIASLLSLQDFPVQQRKSVYNQIGDKVFSKLSSPLALSQFLLSKIINLDEHPVIQIQVLSCLFILVGKYGLQLETFYENLQKIIKKKRPAKSSLFRVSNSKRFLKLVQAAMRSSKIPIKNIVSLSHILLQYIFTERSEYAFWILSFFVNLVKKHRYLQKLLPQFPEIEALKYHYSSRVRALIKELQKNLNKAEYLEISDFSKIDCKKLCEQKLQQIQAKIEDCQQELDFKFPQQLQHI